VHTEIEYIIRRALSIFLNHIECLTFTVWRQDWWTWSPFLRVKIPNIHLTIQTTFCSDRQTDRQADLPLLARNWSVPQGTMQLCRNSSYPSIHCVHSDARSVQRRHSASQGTQRPNLSSEITASTLPLSLSTEAALTLPHH